MKDSDGFDDRRVEVAERRHHVPAHHEPALIVHAQRFHFIEHLYRRVAGRLDALHCLNRENTMDRLVQAFEKAEPQIGWHIVQQNAFHLRDIDEGVPVSRRGIRNQVLVFIPARLPSRMILIWTKLWLLAPDHDAAFGGVTSIIGGTPARAASSMILSNTSAATGSSGANSRRLPLERLASPVVITSSQ